MGIIKKVYFTVSENTFSKCLSRAKDEGMADKDGRVDIGKLFATIAEAWGSGNMVCMRPKKKEEHAERFDYLAKKT